MSALVGAEPEAVPLVDLGLVDPFAEGLDIETKLVRDFADRTPLLPGLSPDLEHEANRSFPQLSWVLPRCWHDSILSKEWSLRETQRGSLQPSSAKGVMSEGRLEEGRVVGGEGGGW